jgi:hypothetical protein
MEGYTLADILDEPSPTQIANDHDIRAERIAAVSESTCRLSLGRPESSQG